MTPKDKALLDKALRTDSDAEALACLKKLKARGVTFEPTVSPDVSRLKAENRMLRGQVDVLIRILKALGVR